MKFFRKSLALLLVTLLICSTGVYATVSANTNDVTVTVKSQQQLFDDTSATYQVGDVFELTILWQSQDFLRNSDFKVLFNSKSLKVTECVPNEKIKNAIIENHTEEIQNQSQMVCANFSIVDGVDYKTEDYIVKYSIEVLEGANESETITLNYKDASGKGADITAFIDYIVEGTVVTKMADQFSLNVTLPSDETNPSESTKDTTPSESTNPSDSSNPSESSNTNPSDETDPSESSNTNPSDETDPSESTKDTTPSESTNPSESTTPSGETDPNESTKDTTPSESTEPSETEHKHEYTSAVTKKATCTAEGVTTYTCACGETYTEPIAKVAHTKVTTSKKATYFENGYKNKVTCKVCKATISKGTTVKKLTLKTPKVKYTGGKKKLTVKYTKVTGATGFQVKYKIGKKTVTKNFNAKKNVNKVIKKLKKGSYKVQIRAFVKSGKKTAYSKWTKAKTVKVK